MRSEVFPRPEALPAEERAETDDAPVLEGSDLKRHFPLVRGSVVPRRVGTVRAANTVLLGVASAVLPFTDAAWNGALQAVLPSKIVEINRRAFQLGRDAAPATEVRK